jgi:hypothetical protein
MSLIEASVNEADGCKNGDIASLAIPYAVHQMADEGA